MSERTPAECWHPSVFIQEEMDARGWNLDELALHMGGSVVVNRAALDLYFGVGPTEAGLRIGDGEDFARAFGVDAEFFLALEAAWLKYVAGR